MVVELADLESPVREIAGVAVGERLLRVQGIPLRDDHVAVPVQEDIILQKDTLRRDDAFTVELQSFHVMTSSRMNGND